MLLRDIKTSISSLSGVGDSTANLFARMGVFTVADLLMLYPREYDDRTKIVPFKDWQKGRVHSIAVVTAHDWLGRGAHSTLCLTLSDGFMDMRCLAFGRAFMEKSFPIGTVVAVTGKASEQRGRLSATAFEFIKLGVASADMPLDEWKEHFRDKPLPDSGVFPIYPLTDGLKQKSVRKIVAAALKGYGIGVEDEVPKELIDRYRLLHKKDALRLVHNPATLSDVEAARRTLIYDELFSLCCTIARRAYAHRGVLPLVKDEVTGGTAIVSTASAAGGGTKPTGTGSTASFGTGDTASASSTASSNSTASASSMASASASSTVSSSANGTASASSTASASGTASDNARGTASSGAEGIAAAGSNVSSNAGGTGEVQKTFTASLSPRQKQLLKALPYPLTNDQLQVITDMNSDIDRGYKERAALLESSTAPYTHLPFTMQRLLQGDVGSGKTLVALFICLRVIDWRGQCAFMAPTELLARQHADNASVLLEPLGVSVAFLSSNIKAKQRGILLDKLSSGDIDIIIGTHALFSSSICYNDLCLAVIDEQHKFGVLQRQAIIAKGHKTSFNVRNINKKSNDSRKSESNASGKMRNGKTKTGIEAVQGIDGVICPPHLLMMSATPIPQSLSLTVFGDLDVSTIHTMPPGRKPITTYLVREGNEQNAYSAVRRELCNGHQAYFVYPAIDAGESGRKSAEEAFDFLSKEVYPEYRCALLHSKVDEDEQIKTIADFRDGKVQVLAATTVIEVGVDVPNASCIVIEGADCFGMAQLHQLRGRVGRGKVPSYCFLIYSKNISEVGIQRMKALRESTDGFFIAEEDLRLRGPGEVFGTAQSGVLKLCIADVCRDAAVLRRARIDAVSYVSKTLLGR